MNATIRLLAALALALALAACVGAPDAPRVPEGKGASAILDEPSLAPRLAELKGTWVLSMLKGAGTAIDLGSDAPTLVFGTRSGEASGSGGCNSYGARYALDGDGGLSFGEFWSTKMFCVDAVAETAYFALLPKVRRYQISGARLALLEEDGTLLALFERAER